MVIQSLQTQPSPPSPFASSTLSGNFPNSPFCLFVLFSNFFPKCFSTSTLSGNSPNSSFCLFVLFQPFFQVFFYSFRQLSYSSVLSLCFYFPNISKLELQWQFYFKRCSWKPLKWIKRNSSYRATWAVLPWTIVVLAWLSILPRIASLKVDFHHIFVLKNFHHIFVLKKFSALPLIQKLCTSKAQVEIWMIFHFVFTFSPASEGNKVFSGRVQK